MKGNKKFKKNKKKNFAKNKKSRPNTDNDIAVYGYNIWKAHKESLRTGNPMPKKITKTELKIEEELKEKKRKASAIRFANKKLKIKQATLLQERRNNAPKVILRKKKNLQGIIVGQK